MAVEQAGDKHTHLHAVRVIQNQERQRSYPKFEQRPAPELFNVSL